MQGSKFNGENLIFTQYIHRRKMNKIHILMATMTKLFEKVSANDWEWIEQLTHSQKEVNWNCIRFRLSLVHRAIEVRALKTFDIFIPSLNFEFLIVKYNPRY